MRGCEDHAHYITYQSTAHNITSHITSHNHITSHHSRRRGWRESIITLISRLHFSNTSPSDSLPSFSVCSKAGLTCLVLPSYFNFSFPLHSLSLSFFCFALPPLRSSRSYPSGMQQQQGLVERKVRRSAGDLLRRPGSSFFNVIEVSMIECLRPP